MMATETALGSLKSAAKFPPLIKQAAQKYYSFAGLRDKRDAASALGRKQGDDFKKNVELQLKDGGKIFDAASDAQRQQFNNETDALADEWGL